MCVICRPPISRSLGFMAFQMGMPTPSTSQLAVQHVDTFVDGSVHGFTVALQNGASPQNCGQDTTAQPLWMRLQH
jgi:hypothetical protein